jgi:hypothetical protein
MGEDRASFEPVLLDLSSTRVHDVLITALEDFAFRLENAAADEEDRVERLRLRRTVSESSFYRAEAAHARALIREIERQMNANRADRRSAP